ncbi:MAG: GNAT family N-acetyltransferase [Chloroflexia bacterium]|nr:GNAT family N-acetyltransferase [Chloroflexia bacterium]
MSDRVDEQQVRIEPWTAGDLTVLRRNNAPEMMAHLGGPETDEQLIARHERYLALNDRDTGQMFRIVLPAEGIAVGGIGVWDSEWRAEAVYETGWSVIPEFQGRGIATAAIGLVAAHARAEGRHQYLHAFPSVENGPSNAVCRKAGFTLIGDHDEAYPPGSTNWMRMNEWRLDLQTDD